MWVCGGIWWGLEDKQVNQDQGVERGGRVNYGMKKFMRELVSSEWIGWQYLRHLESYCRGCHMKTNKLYGAHVFELIRCCRSEFWGGGDAKHGLHIPVQDG